jgi:hypothetical protein
MKASGTMLLHLPAIAMHSLKVHSDRKATSISGKLACD